MEKEKLDLKKPKKEKFHISLYQKEQLLICTMLLCFVLSGLYLPTLKEYFLANSAPEIQEEIQAPIVDDSSDEELTDSETEVTEPDDVESEDTQSENMEPEDIVSNENQTETQKPVTPENNTQTVTPSEKPTTPPNDSDPVDTPTPPTDSDSSHEPADTEEKVWVPPVYEIIHHEAVYETRRVVVCNYCSETFETVGEFQVHKDANGG